MNIKQKKKSVLYVWNTKMSDKNYLWNFRKVKNYGLFRNSKKTLNKDSANTKIEIILVKKIHF